VSLRSAQGQPLRVALGEYDLSWEEPERSLARAAEVMRRAAAAGARLVVLPEMALTGFTMSPDAHAEPLEGARVGALAASARGAGVEVVASIARAATTEAGRRVHRNSAIHVGDAGGVRVVYDKQKLFAYGGEHAAYSAGERAPEVVTIGGVRVATFICYDLRFPELFRAVADDVELVLVVANWPAARRAHWDTLLRARAIENQCWVVGVNRTGTGGGIDYDGGSAAYDPWGDRADVEAGGVRVVDVAAERVREVRERYPFLRDRGR
jgi:predicted amidohydrolase